jgi:hypothetical protein
MLFLMASNKEEILAAKRELIEPREGDKRFVRRDAQGRFNESDDAGRSLSQDRKRSAKELSTSGTGRQRRPECWLTQQAEIIVMGTRHAFAWLPNEGG